MTSIPIPIPPTEKKKKKKTEKGDKFNQLQAMANKSI
jgi:hypothetical protein